MVKSLIFKNSKYDKEQLLWSGYLMLLLAFIYSMFESVKNRENGKDRKENWGEKLSFILIWLSWKYHLSLFGWKHEGKKTMEPGIFHPSLPKCIFPNWREHQVENERKNPNDFFTPVPCCLSLAKVVFFFWMLRIFLFLTQLQIWK